MVTVSDHFCDAERGCKNVHVALLKLKHVKRKHPHLTCWSLVMVKLDFFLCCSSCTNSFSWAQIYVLRKGHGKDNCKRVFMCPTDCVCETKGAWTCAGDLRVEVHFLTATVLLQLLVGMTVSWGAWGFVKRVFGAAAPDALKANATVALLHVWLSHFWKPI